MLIPKTLYGKYRDVSARCRKLATRFIQGNAWDTLFANDELIDTALYPGYIVLDGPSPNLGHEPHFHCFCIFHQINLALDRANLSLKDTAFETPLFEASLQSPWSTAVIIAGGSSFLNCFYSPQDDCIVGDPECFRGELCESFFAACLKYWDIFNGEGVRYTTGMQQPTTIWGRCIGLLHVLSRLGISYDSLHSYALNTFYDNTLPAPSEEFRELVQLALEKSKSIQQFQ